MIAEEINLLSQENARVLRPSVAFRRPRLCVSISIHGRPAEAPCFALSKFCLTIFCCFFFFPALLVCSSHYHLTLDARRGRVCPERNSDSLIKPTAAMESLRRLAVRQLCRDAPLSLRVCVHVCVCVHVY